MINTQNLNNLIKEVDDKAMIIVATKTQTALDINQLKDFGITEIGENRVQELLSKYQDVAGYNWHFIGRLQTNKVKYIVDKVKFIHSVDKESLADEIERQCQKRQLKMNVLIELNCGNESKGGVVEQDLIDLADYIKTKKHLNLVGLMAMPDINAPEIIYKNIYDIFFSLKQKYDTIKYLSLGMTGDYKTALKYGSNMIRIGSLIFGGRA